jgi:hypothetical protein
MEFVYVFAFVLVKQSEREANHSTPSCTESKNHAALCPIPLNFIA